MTDLRTLIDQLRAADAQATPGEWSAYEHNHGKPDSTFRIDISGHPIFRYGKKVASTPVCTLHSGFIWFEGDAKLICLLRNSLPAILAGLELAAKGGDE